MGGSSARIKLAPHKSLNEKKKIQTKKEKALPKQGR